MPPKVAKPRKKANGYRMPEKFNEGFVLKDVFKNNWALGKPIGQGGFGLIYMAYRGESITKNEDAQYVVKIEPKDNGPLFCETHFYANTAKEEDIKSFMQNKGLKHLGIPRYISTGLCTYNGSEYRFLVMDRYARDLQSFLNDSPTHQINEIGVLCLMRQIINTLEYIHSRGYAHGDIKGANVMLKSDAQAYLVDYGLVVRFERDGQQQKYHIKPERRHNGTIEYTSRDAHDGAVINRRSDMEILGYCAMHWLSGTLPWIDLISNNEKVQQSKVKSMSNVKEFVSTTFKNVTNVSDVTKHFLEFYLNEVNKLEYESEPVYAKIQSKITDVLKSLGHSSQVDNFGIFTKTQKKQASSASSAVGRIIDSGDETPAKSATKETNGTTAKKRTAKKPANEETEKEPSTILKETVKTKGSENKKTIEYNVGTDDEDDLLILKPNESKKPRKKTSTTTAKSTAEVSTELETETATKTSLSTASATIGVKETVHPRRAVASRVVNYFENEESDEERKKTQQNGALLKSQQHQAAHMPTEHANYRYNAAQNDMILKMRQTNFNEFSPKPPSSPLALGAIANKSQQDASCILVKKRRNVATVTVATQTDQSIFSSNIRLS